MVAGNTFENTAQRKGLNRMMLGNYFVVLAVLLGRYPNVRPFLTRNLISELAQGFDQIRARNIARQFHRASTSSRTKCKRMILGAAMFSSK